MNKYRIFCPLAVVLCLQPAIAVAADHHVRPGATGRNDGSDWANAYVKLPATLARGDTYYLADGNYGARVFADPASGNATITIRKATEADHGRSAGWSATYGDGQAVFTNWQIHTDHYVFDGQRRNARWAQGETSEYGIKVAGTSPVRLDNGAGVGGDDLGFRYVDFVGGGRDTGAGDDVIYGLTGNSGISFQYCALHDSDRTIFLMRGNWRNLLIDHSYIARNTSSPAIHGELMSMTETNGVTISNNVLEDIEGSAFFAGVNGGTSANWKVFGNVVSHSPAYIANTRRAPDHNWGVSGFIFIGTGGGYDGAGNHIEVYNNTFANIQGLWSGVVIQAGSDNVVRNNIWHNSARTNNSFSGTISHNWYHNTLQDGDSSATKTVCTSGCDIFASPANKDFRLKAAVAGGLSLAAPYSTDIDGVLRGGDGQWDRGAYEFGRAATSSSIAPPTYLVVR